MASIDTVASSQVYRNNCSGYVRINPFEYGKPSRYSNGFSCVDRMLKGEIEFPGTYTMFGRLIESKLGIPPQIGHRTQVIAPLNSVPDSVIERYLEVIDALVIGSVVDINA